LKKIFTKPDYLNLEKLFNDADKYYSKGLGAKLSGNGKKLFKKVDKAPLLSSAEEASSVYSQVGSNEINKCVPKKQRTCDELYGIPAGVVSLKGDFSSADDAIAAINKANAGKVAGESSTEGNVVSLIVQDEAGNKCGWTASYKAKLTCADVSMNKIKIDKSYNNISIDELVSNINSKKQEWMSHYQTLSASIPSGFVLEYDQYDAVLKLDGVTCDSQKLDFGIKSYTTVLTLPLGKPIIIPDYMYTPEFKDCKNTLDAYYEDLLFGAAEENMKKVTGGKSVSFITLIYKDKKCIIGKKDGIIIPGYETKPTRNVPKPSEDSSGYVKSTN
jgi:hypothetical protein